MSRGIGGRGIAPPGAAAGGRNAKIVGSSALVKTERPLAAAG
jgi:hypothetical protein